MEPVIDGQRKRDRPQYGQDNQEESPQRVYQQRGCLKEEFQQFPEPLPHLFPHVIHRLLSVHVYHRVHVPQRPAKLVYLLVKFLITHKESLCRVTQHRFPFQLVFLFLILLHVESLLFNQ